jgi:hypothetical protein
MARCGCGSSCTCLFEDSDSLIITGNGDSTNGYQGELRIDPASPTAVTISAAGISVASVGGGGGGLTDGDKGDITVSGTGTVLTIDNDVVTYAKMQNVTATNKLLGRSTAGAGDVEEITCTATGRSILDDASTSDVRTTIGVSIGSDVQAYSAGLTSIGSLSPSNDDIIQRKSGSWVVRTPAQYGVDLGLVAESITTGITGIAPSQDVVYDALALKEDLANKGANSGYAGLDSGGKLPAAQLTEKAMQYQGTWDATTNTPTLIDGTGSTGDLYLLATAGTQDLGSGSITYAINDLIFYNGTIWKKIAIALDPTLTSLAGYNTNGVLTQTAADTFVGRTLTSGDATQISIVNGDGVSGNPTLSLPASVKITTALLDTNSNETVKFGSIASAVNEVTVTNAATAGSPTIAATGGDTNVSLTLDAKGTGIIRASQAFVSTPLVLSDASTVVTDASLSNHFRVILGGNRILGNPTNPTDGQKIVWELIQDNVGARVITYGGQFVFGSDITSAVLSTAPNKRDFLGAIYNAAETKWYIISITRGY